jgi:eukaryotic-like serine/threonine-protein kinase
MRDQESNHSRGAFVDRLRELAELRAGIEEALAGRGRLFTIAGEPGVGKSRLADKAASFAVAQGVRVLWGRSWEHGGAPAYWPWVQVIRGLTSSVEPTLLADWMGPGAAEIAQMVPELRNQFSGLPELPSSSLAQPEQARFRLFDSVVSFLRRAGDAQPLLTVLDDLHAADPTSLLMLIALSRHISSVRLMVIGTYREVEVKHFPEQAALIAEAEREGVVLPLRGLGENDIGEFIERAWGISPTTSLVNLLHDKTEGNPFFLNEVLRQMAAEGQLASDAKLPKLLSIPRGVSEFIKRLTQPLAEETRNILSIAAVIGREFALNSLERASQMARELLIELLDQAISLELISEVPGTAGRYSFRHALIREALYDSLAPARRRKLHHIVAEAIRIVNAPAEPFAEIAYHYCQGAPLGDAELAIEYSRQAARTAEKQLAYEEAVHHLSNAIEVLALKRSGDEPLHAELLCDLGKAQIKAGDLSEARKTCLRAADISRRLNESELFVSAVVAAGRGISNSGVTDHNLVLLLNEAQEMLGDRDSPLRAQVLARLGIELYWSERKQAVALCQQAVEMAKRLDDPHTSIVALWGRYLSLRNPDSLEQRLTDAREVITVAERAGERDFALEARFYRIADLLESGNIADADVEQVEYLTAEAELRDRFKRGLMLQGMRALMEGRLDESEMLAQQAFVAGQQSGRPLALNAFLIQHGKTLWERGRLGELEAQLRAFVSRNPLIVFARCALQLCLIELGRRDDARIEFEHLAKDEFRLVPRDWNWLPAMFVLAEVCAELGEVKHAETLYRLLGPYSSHNAMLGWVYSYGSIAFALGKLAAVRHRFEDAEAHFEAALAANRRSRATVWFAHTQCELASTLFSRGESADRERAHELIASARQTAEALDLVRLGKKLELISIGDKALKDVAAIPITGGSDGKAKAEPRSPVGATAGTWGLGASDAVATTSNSRTRAGKRVERRLTAIFAADVAGYGRLTGVDEEGTHVQLKQHLHVLVDPKITEYRGRVVKNTGDGMLAEFGSVVDAVRCAIDIQQGMAERNAGIPHEKRIEFRIGINVGDVIIDSGDIFGDGVNVAVRLEGIAEPGGICVSARVHEYAQGQLDIAFVDAGERPLKNIARPTRVYVIKL